MAASADIRNLSLPELKSYLTSIGEKPYRAVQIFEGIYKNNAVRFEDLTTLAQPLRERLAKDFVFPVLALAHKDSSSDGTGKFLWSLPDGEKVESVYIPTERFAAVCLSTQVGCKFRCGFCASGLRGFTRNLETGEILAQLLSVKGAAAADKKELTHVVFMGIGEPLDNYENVLKAIRTINAKEGLNIGARRITISTSGVAPRIRDLIKEDLQIELAVSLHGWDNASRDRLMPVNKAYPLEVLMSAIHAYLAATNRQVTFEYILIKGMTDADEAVKGLAKLLKGLEVKMNLIPCNPVVEFGFVPPALPEMLAFRDRLYHAGVHATIRMPRGRDIAAACGQLRHNQTQETP